MGNGRLRDFKEELQVFVQETVGLMENYETAEETALIERVIEETLSRYHPSLMFYGVYNAGKSTILNAIFGEGKASVADVPETHQITEYPWKGYGLVDTPGINGPERDFQLSSAELSKHDVILFVIDDSEDFDKRNVAQEVLKIINNNKLLIIVLNNKQIRDTEEEDEQRFQDIRVKFFANLKKEAELEGITNIEKRYSFIRVNGDSALRGKLRNSQALIRDSHIDDLEILILQKLKEMDGPQILKVPADMLLTKVINLQNFLENQAMSVDERELLVFMKELMNRKSLLYQGISQKVKHEIYQASEQIYQLANQGKDAQPVLLQLQEHLDGMIHSEIGQAMKILDTEAQISKMEIPLRKLAWDHIKESDHSRDFTKYKGGSESNLAEIAVRTAGAAGIGALTKKAVETSLLTALPGTLLPKIPPVLIGEVIVKVVDWFLNNKKRQKELEDMQRQIAEANARQEEMVNKKIAMLQELNTQVRLQMYKYEEEIMESVRNFLEEIFGEIEENVYARIASISEIRDQTNQHLHQLRKLKANIENFKLALEA